MFSARGDARFHLKLPGEAVTLFLETRHLSRSGTSVVRLDKTLMATAPPISEVIKTMEQDGLRVSKLSKPSFLLSFSDLTLCKRWY